MMRVEDLGWMSYRDAWAVQERAHAAVVDGTGPERLLLVEHDPPVITFGRRPGGGRAGGGADGGGPVGFLVANPPPPVITFGRRPGVEGNVVAPPQRLEELGVEVVPSDRGGDVTFHGPGQLVAYPIVRLIDHK